MRYEKSGLLAAVAGEGTGAVEEVGRVELNLAGLAPPKKSSNAALIWSVVSRQPCAFTHMLPSTKIGCWAQRCHLQTHPVARN
jgi:hypothetical protein